MEARRLTCTGVRQAEWETYEIPETPGPHELIVEAACSLVSVGTEMAVYGGTHIGYTIPNPPEWLKFPTTLGYALAGTVRAVGSQVEGWAAGDRVLASVPHGDRAVCDVRRQVLRRLPEGVSMEEGALARMGGISMVSVRQAGIALGETVVVLGLGLIGQFAAQLSRVSGARPVIGADLIADRVQVAAASGIQAVNPSQVDLKALVAEATDGRMAEVVIEATGNPAVVETALELAAEGGRVVLLGSLRGKVEIDAYSTVHRLGISLIGAHDRLSAHAPTLRDPWTRERNLDLVLSLFADGSLRSEGLIGRRIRPAEVLETYARIVERPGDVLGVVIEWGGNQQISKSANRQISQSAVG